LFGASTISRQWKTVRNTPMASKDARDTSSPGKELLKRNVHTNIIEGGFIMRISLHH